MEPRPLFREVYEAVVEEHVVPFVLAPPGYGKTVSSQYLYTKAKSDGVARGVIHVLPYRAIIDLVYEGLFKGLGGAYYDVGVSSRGVRSEYLLHPFTVTTLEAYFLNAYRLPHMEYGFGELGSIVGGISYVSLASIASSITVLEDAHLYTGIEDVRPRALLIMFYLVAGLLAKLGASFVIESTFLPRDVAEQVIKLIRGSTARLSVKVFIPTCAEYDTPPKRLVRGLRGGADVVFVEDCDWAEKQASINIDSGVVNGWNTDTINAIVELAEKGLVIVIGNGYKEAQTLYRLVRSSASDDINVRFLSERLAEEERAEILSWASIAGSGVLVATPVIEASSYGLNPVAVFTSPAPVEHLAKRAGLVCREERGACSEEGGVFRVVVGGSTLVYELFFSPNSTRLAVGLVEKYGPRIKWRCPCSTREGVGYFDLVFDPSLYARRPYTIPVRGIIDAVTSHISYDGLPRFTPGALGRNICIELRDAIPVPIITARGEAIVELTRVLGPERDMVEDCPFPCIEMTKINAERKTVSIAGAEDKPELSKILEWEEKCRYALIETWKLWEKKGASTGCNELLEAIVEDVMRGLLGECAMDEGVYRWSLVGRSASGSRASTEPGERSSGRPEENV